MPLVTPYTLFLPMAFTVPFNLNFPLIFTFSPLFFHIFPLFIFSFTYPPPQKKMISADTSPLGRRTYFPSIRSTRPPPPPQPNSHSNPTLSRQALLEMFYNFCNLKKSLLLLNLCLYCITEYFSEFYGPFYHIAGSFSPIVR